MTGRRPGDRLAVGALGLLLGLSVAIRLFPPAAAMPPAAGDQAVAVDFGTGPVLAPAMPEPRAVLIGACWTPIPVEFVDPLPHGTDTTLAGPNHPGDRVFYAYRGWMLSGPFTTVELAILHLVGRGASILRLEGAGARAPLAARITMPAGCGAAPEDAVAALRREMQAGQ